METHTGEVSQQTILRAEAKRKIDRRVKRSLANPSITSEQRRELFALASAIELSLYFAPEVAVKYFIKPFAELSDTLTIPEDPGEQK